MGELTVGRTTTANPGTGVKTQPKNPSPQDPAPTSAVADKSIAKAPATGSIPATAALPQADDLGTARQERAQGVAEYRRGNYAAAEQHLRKSVEAYTAVTTAGDPGPKVMVEWISTMSDLGRAIYNQKEVPADQRAKNLEVVNTLYQQTSESFRMLVEVPDLQKYAPLYTGILGLNLNVALAYQDQGDLDRAETLLKSNLSLATKLGDMKELSLSLSQTNLNLAVVYSTKGEVAAKNKDTATARAQFRAAQNVLAQSEERVRAAGGGPDWATQSAVIHQRQAFLALRLAQLDGTTGAKGQEELKEARRLGEQARAEFQQLGHAEGVKATQQVLDQIKVGRADSAPFS